MKGSVILCAAVVALLATASTGAPGTLRASDRFSLSDRTGDSAAAPDIVQVVAGSNARSLEFLVRLANRSSLQSGDFVTVWIDGDANPLTGYPGLGVDVVLQVGQDARLFRWSGGQFVAGDATPLHAYFSRGVGFSIVRTAIGAGPIVRFWAQTNNGQAIDTAPDGAELSGYAFSSRPLRLQIVGLQAPRAVAAGRAFSIRAQVRRSDLGEASGDGSAGCTARVGGRAVHVAAAFPGDVLTCSGTAPASARGKTLRVSLSLAVEGVVARRTVPILVR